jgi:hypothetical protein
VGGAAAVWPSATVEQNKASEMENRLQAKAGFRIEN